MNPTAAEMAIEAVEVAECNLLQSFINVTPDQVYSQILPELNSIGWIFGHCIVHYQWVIDLSYQEKRTLSKEVCNYFRYGTTKEEILQNKPPISFRDLVDSYLSISKSSLEYLRNVDENMIYKEFVPEPEESLLQHLHRMAFHFMGHMGQIVMIKRALGNPGPSFVDGITKPQRDMIMEKWYEWWTSSRNDFHP
ncbi:MAG: hypothetical protein P1Q69_02950 [Candidatus Thorarchaeota archaeon]|nr:hypothetical protein [Candidatus Thorarchaeota archaeon]